MPSTTKKTDTAATARKKTAASRLASNARVLRQFRVVINSVKTHFRQVEKMAGVGGAQLWALSVIQSNPGLGMNELAQAMDIHQSTASNLVKMLAAQEMVEAAKTGTDRRAVALHILPAGASVLKRRPRHFPACCRTHWQASMRPRSPDWSKTSARSFLHSMPTSGPPIRH